jgi:hypothetical protein
MKIISDMIKSDDDFQHIIIPSAFQSNITTPSTYISKQIRSYLPIAAA